jgi:hypothetical protein
MYFARKCLMSETGMWERFRLVFLNAKTNQTRTHTGGPVCPLWACLIKDPSWTFSDFLLIKQGECKMHALDKGAILFAGLLVLKQSSLFPVKISLVTAPRLQCKMSLSFHHPVTLAWVSMLAQEGIWAPLTQRLNHFSPQRQQVQPS